jgi:hypothetical protein
MAAKLTRLTHKIGNTTAPSGRELYHLQFSLQAASSETFDTPSYHLIPYNAPCYKDGWECVPVTWSLISAVCINSCFLFITHVSLPVTAGGTITVLNNIICDSGLDFSFRDLPFFRHILLSHVSPNLYLSQPSSSRHIFKIRNVAPAL